MSKIEKDLINKEEREIIKEEQDHKFDDELDIKKEVISVHTERIKKSVTTDIVLAKLLDDKDKQYVIDMAYSGKYCMDAMLDQLGNWRKFYELQGLKWNKADEKEILKTIEDTYGLFMDRIAMVCLVNRNVTNNPLIEAILRIPKISEESPTHPASVVDTIQNSPLKNEEAERQKRGLT